MNWFADITPPGIKKMFRHRDDKGDTLWTKCPSCEEMVFNKDLEAALHVCPSCSHHMPIGAKGRLDALFGRTWEKIELPEVPDDPLRFRDTKKYTDRLREYRRKTGERDALIIGKGSVGGVPLVAVAQNFAFMGGSMGMGLGEGIVKAAEVAVEAQVPLVLFSASGGARMQEGILSLMQMPRTTIAVQMLRDAGLPYIVVLTHPTTGGVTASYAMLGDVHIAEPGALIGFAGPRVIEQTIREKLPEGFQRAEYLRDKGMVDMVVDRRELSETLTTLLRTLTKADLDAVAAARAEKDEAEAAAEREAPESEEAEAPADEAEAEEPLARAAE
ncbi:acetyl-CoA carboxylase, carboxyltransferase subunit beta [Parvularcula oceani]|uniref:acetyl-CoA carboxylase, carboxyltransferase subunit beta n=1 Tax=Parvularcula oceani TaxID=1247963 RepID=UPI00056A01C5|nr:acetyl-CoA carboxylase, carboxyltransferase subunit beta [Parvularcula oceani]